MARADLHLHTSVSDGLASVERLLEHVEYETDLAVVAVTDHEDARGGLVARELAAKRGYRVQVVPGAEVTTRHGHLLALWVEDAPPSFRSVETTLEATHARGGIAIIPHPLSWLTRSIGERTIDRIQSRGEAEVTFDAIELCNPSPAGRRTRDRAVVANARWGLATTGSSDAHHLVHVASGWTEFPGETAGDLRAAILAGTTVARMGRYAPPREVGLGRTAAQLAWGLTATPRKMLRPRRGTAA